MFLATFNFIKEKRTLLLILIQLVAAIILSSIITIWIDEAYTLNTTSKGIGYAFTQAIGFEGQPPLYFVLVAAWRIISKSIFWARMFSILSISISILYVHYISKQFVNQLNAFLITLLFALHPVVTWAAIEIRPYALLIMFCAMNIYYFTKYCTNPDTKNRIKYIIVAVLGLFTHYYFGFILLANGVYLLIKDRKFFFKKYIVDMIVPLVFLIAFAKLIIANTSLHVNNFNSDRSDLDIPNFIRYRIEYYTILNPELNLRGWGANMYKIIFGVFIFIVLMLQAQNGSFKKLFQNWKKVLASGPGKNHVKKIVIISKNGLPLNYYLIISLVLLFCMSLVYWILGQFFVSMRYNVILLLPLFILFSSAMFSIIPWKKIFWIFASILLIIYTIANYKTNYKFKDSISEIAKFFNKEEKPNEPIFIYRNTEALVFSYYYHGINRMFPLPGEFSFETYDVKNSVIENKEEGLKTLEYRLLPGTKKFWLVYDHASPYNIAFNQQEFATYVSSKYTLEKDTMIYGITLHKYIVNK